MWGGITLRSAHDRAPALCSALKIFSRGITASRIPVTDVEPLKAKLEPSQINIPVVVRRHTPPLRKKNGPPKRLTGRHSIYDPVTTVPQRFPDIEVILTKTTPGYGLRGAKLKVRGDKAYHELILPRSAVYASPENVKKYAALCEEQTESSTITAARTSDILSKIMVGVTLSMDNPWTIQKWHIKVSFRKLGIVVPEECIELPEKPITGPDITKEGKHFIVAVTINNKERVLVRCGIHHVTPNEDAKLPYQPFWWKRPANPLFPEDASKFESFPPVRGRDPTDAQREEYGL